MIDDLDGVIAAPDHHTVMFEHEVVRVRETIRPHARGPLRPWPERRPC